MLARRSTRRPTRPRSTASSARPTATPGNNNINSYDVSMGTTTQNTHQQTTGMFAYQTKYGLRDMHRRQFEHDRLRPRRWWATRSTPRSPGQLDWQQSASNSAANQYRRLGHADGHHDRHRACNAKFVPGQISNDRGTRWGCGVDGLQPVQHRHPPQRRRRSGAVEHCRMDCCTGSGHAHYENATSNHSGGVNA